jgi:hypothetical protein
MAQEGRIAPNDPIGTSQGWVKAADLPELKPHLGGDPWSVWDSAESAEAEEAYRSAMENQDPPELSAAEISPLMVIESKPSPATLSTKAMTPLMEVVAKPEPKAVPKPSPAPSISTAPRLPVSIPPALPPSKRATSSSLNIVRILTWIMVGMMVMLVGYVSMKIGGSTQGIPYTGGVSPKKEATPSPENPLLELDRELRSQLPKDARPIQEAGDFSDNLTVELQQMKVELLNADGLVTKWATVRGENGKREEPQVAEIRITIRESESLARDLGAVGLVVGRYIHLYRLEVPIFQLNVTTEEGVLRKNLVPQQADAFYMGTIKLSEFLELEKNSQD